MAGKTGIRLDQTRIVAGLWEGLLIGAEGGVPVIEASQGGRVIEGVDVQPVAGKSGAFAVRVPIPAWALNEGVQTFLVQSGGVTLAAFTIISGQPLEADIRSEISLLRAELDLLKRAFQRHVREG